MYFNLYAEMKKKGITQAQIASALGVSRFTVHHKMSGKSEFTSGEMFKIRNTFFKSKTLDELFSK